MNDLFSTAHPVHILRLYLPPWRLDERLEEIIRWCDEVGCQHVMLFTDAQFMVWNQMNEHEQEEVLRTLHAARDRFAGAGIRLGINSSYNMRVSRADQRGHIDFDHWATYADGVTDFRGPCLLDPKLELYLRGFYGRLATLEADYIYVDDDHRYMLQGERETWGCLCDLHLRTFAQRMGRSFSRESLNRALLADASVRGEWMAFLGERLTALATLIEDAVHAVSPSTKVGMMVPCLHCLPPVGHNLKKVLSALHPGAGKPLVRPSVGGYQDWRRRDLFAGLWYREFTRHWLGADVEYTSEIECCPGTRLSKSMAATRFQIVHGLLQEINVSALSPASYVGDTPFLEPEFAAMLKRNRPYFDVVWRDRPSRGTGCGVQLYWDFDSPLHAGGTLSSVTDLWWPAFVVAEWFGHLGIPTTYDESPIKAFFGDSVCSLPRAQLLKILAGPVLLDAAAAAALNRSGFGNLVGCGVGDAVGETAGAEQLTDAAFSGEHPGAFMPFVFNRLESVRVLEPSEGAREISAIVTHDLDRLAPGVVLYMNEAGGRVAILPYAVHAIETDISHLVCYHRRAQLKSILRWLSEGALPVWVDSPTDIGVHLWETEAELTLCMTNMSFDILDHVVLELDRDRWRGDHGEWLDEEGCWQPLSAVAHRMDQVDTLQRWRLNLSLKPLYPLICRFNSGEGCNLHG